MRLHWRVLGSTISPTEVGSRRRVFRVLWDLECPIGLSQKVICTHFNEGILAQFGRSDKKNSGLRKDLVRVGLFP